jgi:hypothetical protein
VAEGRDGRGVDRDLMKGELGEAEAVDSLEVEGVPRLEVEVVNKLEIQEVCRHGAVAVR